MDGCTYPCTEDNTTCREKEAIPEDPHSSSYRSAAVGYRHILASLPMAEIRFGVVTHCIFDLDGTMLDTEKFYTQAIQSILDKYGKTLEWEFKLTLMGLHSHEFAQRIVERYELPLTWQEYSQMQREATKKLMPCAELFPDTEVVYENIVKQILKEFNKTYPHEVRVKVLGTNERKTAEIIIKELKLPISVDAFLTKFHKLCRGLLGDTKLMKGVERLVHHLHANCIPIAVATSSSEPMVKIKIAKYHKLFELMHHTVCGSTDPEVKLGKPAPDIFLIAAQRFGDGVKASSCLVFEDAPNGVTAGIAAGMQVVMIPDESTPPELRTKATLVLKSMEDFRPEQFGLPPFVEVDH